MQLKSIGADPELFLVDNDGKLKSAIGRIEGTKTEPKPIPFLGKGFALQADNVLLEFNIPPSTFTSLRGGEDGFVLCNTSVLAFLSKELAKMGLKYDIRSSAVMPDEELADPRAHIFGCEPDFNAWTLEDNPQPQCNDPALRSAGGHIHIGGVFSKLECVLMARWLDVLLGGTSVLVDTDNRRRQLYGKAGAIRFKPYGFEYRTLSNFWLNSADNMRWVCRGVQKAFEYVSMGKAPSEELVVQTLDAINNGDPAAAIYLQRSGYGIQFAR